MKIGIVGVGIVGGACKYGFEKLGHDVRVHDIKLGTKLEDVMDSEICFICVPTPSSEDGSCNTDIVEETVEQLYFNDYEGMIAIKSTVEPGTTQRLLDTYEDLRLCFVPEFLRERCAVSDFTENHKLLAVGAEHFHEFKLIHDAHGRYPENVVWLNPTEAELLKYVHNTFNATRVVFANVFFEVCKVLGANFTKLKDAYMLLGYASDHYMDVNENFRGYGGMCLPKDTKAMAALCKKHSLQLTFFDAIDAENAKFKTTVLPGMRP